MCVHVSSMCDVCERASVCARASLCRLCVCVCAHMCEYLCSGAASRHLVEYQLLVAHSHATGSLPSPDSCAPLSTVWQSQLRQTDSTSQISHALVVELKPHGGQSAPVQSAACPLPALVVPPSGYSATEASAGHLLPRGFLEVSQGQTWGVWWFTRCHVAVWSQPVGKYLLLSTSLAISDGKGKDWEGQHLFPGTACHQLHTCASLRHRHKNTTVLTSWGGVCVTALRALCTLLTGSHSQVATSWLTQESNAVHRTVLPAEDLLCQSCCGPPYRLGRQ